jgi:TPR repeat protein
MECGFLQSKEEFLLYILHYTYLIQVYFNLFDVLFPDIMSFCRILIDGFTSIKGSKLTEAVHMLQKAADRRSPQAEHFLALMYEYGRGVPQDFQKSIMYYMRASEQHNVESMYNLALMYMFNRGVKQDFKMALPLLQKAAENNHAPATYYLGVLKMNGHGTNVDYEEAMGWFEKAAVLNDMRISGLAADSYRDLRQMLDEANEQNFRVLDEYMARNAADLAPQHD